jgi:hypothetical protein
MERLWNTSKPSMGLNNMKYPFFLLMLVFFSHLLGEESIPPQVDMSDISIFNNPLEGIKAFTVLLSGQSKENEPETKFFIQELKKMGSVKAFSLSQPPINYEGMGTGMRLTLITSQLDVLGDSASSIMRVSLFLSTSVEVVKTKHPLNSYIWESNAFAVKGNTMEALKKLLKQFTYYYHEANPNDKPLFYVYL